MTPTVLLPSEVSQSGNKLEWSSPRDIEMQTTTPTPDHVQSTKILQGPNAFLRIQQFECDGSSGAFHMIYTLFGLVRILIQ